MTTTVMRVSDKTLKFQNSLSGKTLELSEIINSKKIVLIKFSYLTEPQMVRVKGIKGLFGAKTMKQEERNLIIADTKGITLNVKQTGTVIARFSRKSEFEKISKLDYDDTTLQKNCIMNFIRPYSVNFHVQNLKSVFWEDK